MSADGAHVKYRPILERLETRLLLSSGGRPDGSALAQSEAQLFDRRALHVLKKSPKTALAAAVAAGPDGQGSVTITGKSLAKAKVTLDVGTDGSIEQTVKANSRGQF